MLALLIGLPDLARAQQDATDGTAQGEIEAGEYIFNAAGCLGCHTDKKNEGPPLAGGRALKTPFGTFHSPNITPDKETGIGTWSFEDFKNALHEGRAREGHYFPSFPYTSYTGITDEDLRTLWAYLKTVPAVRRENKPHDLDPPFGWRFLLGPWKWLNFEEGRFEPDPGRSEQWNRGAYIVNHLAHCGECHTPRSFLGGLKDEMKFAGTKDGPEGGKVPNITPDKETGIGNWTESDLMMLFEIGMLKNGDFVGGGMAEVVENTGKLTKADREAIIVYLKSLPPIKAAH